MPSGFTTRFAPAPTGLLHLGHVVSAVAVWGLARAFSGKVLLRIEDHDRMRCRPEFEAAILEDLEWLGLTPDEPFVRQSDRQGLYEEALRRLESDGLVYPCACSRRSIEARAPQGEGERRYPGTCRDLELDGGVMKTRRLRLEPQRQAFRDLRLGPINQVPSEQGGDLLIRDRQGQWTYQFAVVVDDFNQGVDLVIRGEDLLSSTGRQLQLSSLLGRAAPPAFLHHPLLTDEGGRKLSKANGETGLRELRAAGYTVERLLGLAALALGLGTADPVSFTELVGRLQAQARSAAIANEDLLVH